MPCASINDFNKVPVKENLRILNLEDSPFDSELNLVNLEADEIQPFVKGDGFPLRLSPEKETILFRIAQETLTNIAKHAKADRVDSILEKKEDLFLLSVADNGCGFDFEGFRPGNEKGGWGLAFRNERTIALGGELLVESESGKGTRITLSLPFKE